MTPKERLDGLLKEIDEEFGGQVKIEVKENQWYWKFLGFLHNILMLGKSTFMTTMTTVAGPRIGVRPGMHDADLYITLLHERAHLRQSAAICKNLWVGAFFHGLLYLLVLPVVFTLRAKYEKEGYAETIRGWIQIDGYLYVKNNHEALRRLVVGHFLTAKYGWMCPFEKKMNKWYDETVERVAREEGVL